VTDLGLIYESVTSLASVHRWLTLHSWTLNSTQLQNFWTLLRTKAIRINYVSSLYNSVTNRTEITISNSSSIFLCLSVAAETCVNFVATVWFRSLQLSVFVSMENVFCNQLISKNQSLRGNALANSLPRNGSHVTICKHWNNQSQQKPIWW
jgi:hypothetical protein